MIKNAPCSAVQCGWLFHDNRNNYFSPFDFILNQFDDQLYILCNEFVPVMIIVIGTASTNLLTNENRFWTILVGYFFSTSEKRLMSSPESRLRSPHLSLGGVTLPGIKNTKTRHHETNCRESINCSQKSAQMRMLFCCGCGSCDNN